MIVTAWIIQDLQNDDPARSISRFWERRIYNEAGHVDTTTFLNDIRSRQAMNARVEFGPVSETGWGR